MSQSRSAHLTALCTRATLMALVYAGCAHGGDPSASSAGSDASVSHAGGSAAMGPAGSPGTGGSSMDISGGSAGEGGTGGGEIADAEMVETGAGGGAGSSTDAATTATPDAKDSGSAVEAAAPDAGCPNPTACSLRAALIHRYMFDGTGTTATDSIGTANGTVMNTTLTGTGSL